MRWLLKSINYKEVKMLDKKNNDQKILEQLQIINNY